MPGVGDAERIAALGEESATSNADVRPAPALGEISIVRRDRRADFWLVRQIGCDLRASLRRRQSRMPKKYLDEPDTSTAPITVSSKAVPQNMCHHPLIEAGMLPSFAASLLEVATLTRSPRLHPEDSQWRGLARYQ